MRTACWIALTLIIGLPKDGWACSCVPRSPCALYGAADAVFLGHVVDVRREGRLRFARLEVTHAWKGTVDRLVTVSNEADTSCSFDFPIGQRFLVYGEGAGATFRAHLCAGGGPLRAGDPQPDLPPRGGRVTGDVLRFNESFTNRDNITAPMAGTRVWIATGSGVLETRADANGRFTLDTVPVGTHTIHADVGPELEGSARVALRSPSDCGSVLIMPKPSGRIAGTLSSAGGIPVRGTQLYAVPLNHDWTKQNLSDTQKTTATEDGVFEFDGLKPGQYLLTVNVVSPPRVSQPFPPTYYPGVEDARDAVVVDVGHGQTSASAPFVLWRTLPRTTIDADILCRDESAPRSAIVYATQVDNRSFWRESTYERIDGHLRLTVLQGVPYDVHGVVLVATRDATGREVGFTGVRTPVVRVDPGSPPSIVRLVAPLDGCQETTIDGSRRP